MSAQSVPRFNRNFFGRLVADRGWKRSFDEPIPLPRGHQLVTLEDAGRYITKLPKAEHNAPEWQAAMEALELVDRLGVAEEDRRCLRGLASCEH